MARRRHRLSSQSLFQLPDETRDQRPRPGSNPGRVPDSSKMRISAPCERLKTLAYPIALVRAFGLASRSRPNAHRSMRSRSLSDHKRRCSLDAFGFGEILLTPEANVQDRSGGGRIWTVQSKLRVLESLEPKCMGVMIIGKLLPPSSDKRISASHHDGSTGSLGSNASHTILTFCPG